jgi:phosphoglucosamine mutase
MVRTGRKLSDLAAGFEHFPQAMKSIHVAGKRPLESLPSLQAAIRRIETELAGGGRVLIRYSGTENKARVMVEGQNEEQVNRFVSELCDELQRALAAAS